MIFGRESLGHTSQAPQPDGQGDVLKDITKQPTRTTDVFTVHIILIDLGIHHDTVYAMSFLTALLHLSTGTRYMKSCTAVRID